MRKHLQIDNSSLFISKLVVFSEFFISCISIVYRVLFQEHGARVDVTDNDGVILGSFGAFYPKLGAKYESCWL